MATNFLDHSSRMPTVALAVSGQTTGEGLPPVTLALKEFIAPAANKLGPSRPRSAPFGMVRPFDYKAERSRA